MKLTLSDGRVLETDDPIHRVVLLEIQLAFEAFRQAAGILPDDTTHPAYGELVEEARGAGGRVLRASQAMRHVLLDLGAGEEAVAQFESRTLSEVRAFLALHEVS